MTCPFLKEAPVKYCRTASFRKLIPLPQTTGADEKCSSADYVTCPVYRSQPEEAATAGLCPFLCESLMQYCGAAPVTRFVPYSESLLSRCGNGSYIYCELYHSVAHPSPPAGEVDGVPLPASLGYTANHMWLDVTEGGACHAGVDAFFSRVLGQVDHIAFVWHSGLHRPAAVLTVGGMELEVIFPNQMLLTNCNLHLRADPARLLHDPYRGGWLFEGRVEESTADHLRRGEEAREWMEQELRRINEFLQQSSTGVPACEVPLAADGGQFAPGLVQHLNREQIRALFHEFFSPYAGGQNRA